MVQHVEMPWGSHEPKTNESHIIANRKKSSALLADKAASTANDHPIMTRKTCGGVCSWLEMEVYWNLEAV